MESTLFVEMNGFSARLMLYTMAEDQQHYLDITGGYGKKSIPLYMHYNIEGEVFIGEDAFFCDIEDGSEFIHILNNNEIQEKADFIEVLLEKVKGMIPDLIIFRLVLISNHSTFKSKAFEEEALIRLNKVFGHQEKAYQIQSLSYTQAIAGWLYYHGKGKTGIIYLDEEKIYLYNPQKENQNKVFLNEKALPFPLNKIDEFYLNELHQQHFEDYNHQEEHQIRQLYNNQMSQLQQQVISQKKVNIYSSILFPPRKLELHYEVFNQFWELWKQEFMNPLEKMFKEVFKDVDEVVLSGGFDKQHYLMNESIFKRVEPIKSESLILEGAYVYIDHMLKKTEILGLETMDQTIGIYNEGSYLPLVTSTDRMMEKVCFDLLLTNHQDELQFYSKEVDKEQLVYTLKIVEPKALQRIIVTIEFNLEKEIKEVSYELRNI